MHHGISSHLSLPNGYFIANAGHINGGEGHGNKDGDGATTPTFVLMDSDPAGSKIVGTAIKIEGVEVPAAVAEVQVLRLIDQGEEQG